MEEQLITFDTAKIAKEKGFDLEFCNVGWHGDFGDLKGDSYPFLGTYSFYKSIYCNNKDEHQIQRPTQSLLQKWLRDVHNIFVEVNTDCTSAPKFSFDIKQFVGNPKDLSDKEWDWVFPIQNENWGLDRIYEISLEAGLQEGLKLVKYEMVK